MSTILEINAGYQFFAVADDPECYDQTECIGSGIVEAWKDLMYCPAKDTDPEEVRQFEEFANDPDNWRQEFRVLEWPVGGESSGTITFYRKTRAKLPLEAAKGDMLGKCLDILVKLVIADDAAESGKRISKYEQVAYEARSLLATQERTAQ